MTHENPYDSLSTEVKARLKDCKTPEEILALAQEEGYELSDEELQGIAGGGGWCESNVCGRYTNNKLSHRPGKG